MKAVMDESDDLIIIKMTVFTVENAVRYTNLHEEFSKIVTLDIEANISNIKILKAKKLPERYYLPSSIVSARYMQSS